jgi:hypothetical protein
VCSPSDPSSDLVLTHNNRPVYALDWDSTRKVKLPGSRRLGTWERIWNLKKDSGAAPRGALDLDFSSEQLRPFPHADQPEVPTPLDEVAIDLEALPIVFHDQDEVIAAALQHDGGVLGFRVLVDVVECLLCDTVDLRLHFGLRPPVHETIGVQLRADAKRRRPVPDELFQGRHQPEIERCWPKFCGYEIQGSVNLLSRGLRLGNLSLHVGSGRGDGGPFQFQAEARQPLTNVVVQVAGNTPSLILDGRQPSGECHARMRGALLFSLELFYEGRD